jgi:hypothetical protein
MFSSRDDTHVRFDKISPEVFDRGEEVPVEREAAPLELTER